MKRMNAVYAAGLAVFLLGGCAGQQNNVAYIGAEKAKELALEASGLSASDVTFSETDLSSRSGKDYYLVGFTASGEEYEYDIDALTGVVIESRMPEAASGAEQSADADSAGTEKGNESVSAGKKKAGDSNENTENVISAEEAAANAAAHAGVSDSDITIVKNKLEMEDGRQVYDIEFYTDDYAEYDYEIDAVTGEIIGYDYDAENFSKPKTSGEKISEAEAKKLALDRVPGASADNIWEFEVDQEDGRLEYEGKIIYDEMEYEFEIDAYSGAFRSWESEPAD